MNGPTPKNVKSSKTRIGSINGQMDATSKRSGFSMSKTQSHFLVSSDRLDKVTRRVIAPYAQIERRGLKDDKEKPDIYLDINRFDIFLEDTVDLDKLLYETAMVLKSVTNSSGVFVYIVDKLKNEIVLLQPETKNPQRHEINIPIEEGKTAAAHAAYTKQHLILDDVQRDRRFSEGLKWVEAKSALCMPVVKPDGDCHAVLELYRTYEKKYEETELYTVVGVVCWAGAAVHQAQARVSLQKTAHLNNELRALLQNYFCDLASIDIMLTDMLAVVKSFMGAMRSSFYIIDKSRMNELILADMWDDGWSSEKTVMPRKKNKINLSLEETPASLVARTGENLNVRDAYKDPRFVNEIDPTTGAVVRSCLVSPILDKTGVIGVVQLTNKNDGRPFNSEDEEIFSVFVSYCSLIVHFYNMEQKQIYHCKLNKVYSELLCLHLKPCSHDIEDLLETNVPIVPPVNLRSYDFHISDTNKEDMAALVCYMFNDVIGTKDFDCAILANFVLTVLQCYRDNAYHNAEHAFSFVHTQYLILVDNPEYFNHTEIIALMLAGLCHDLDHPGYNNNFLALCKHPLANMYKSSMLEHHHFFLAKKIIEDKMLLAKLTKDDQERIIDEMEYNILCTDLAIYFQIRAQLSPILADHSYDWDNNAHRKMLKGIIMTTCDLSACCKPFGVAKTIALQVYEEFYEQGDRERALGYTPLSMMDRRRCADQPAEQIQFISVVVLPCLMLLQTVFPSTAKFIDNCRRTQECWHEEIEMRGQKLWRQEESLFNVKRAVSIKTDEEKV